MRGILNVAALLVLVCGLLALFAGYPIIAHFVHKSAGTLGGFGLGGTNGTGQVAFLNGLRNLIDEDTKEADKTWTSGTNGNKYQLVFSDEFQQEGRTFWPGDDPFWEAVDIWYGATGDYEWYSPEAINTTGGALQIVMRQKETHNLNFQSGMLQSWNKFCFQGGYIEMAVQLPGRQDTRGFWPGLWTMGNLGRPGYLGSTEGMWPYSYDSCDYGTLPNQTNPQGTGPPRVLNAQGPYSKNYDNKLSYLPGQRASACTCAGEDHPGPSHDVGRASPEIDILEAQNTHSIGEASQSLQTAPFDPDYAWDETAATFYGTAKANSYTGSVYQEAVSGISNIPADSYHDAAGARFVTYGFEYQPDWNKDGSGWITWYMDGKKTWTVTSDSVPARTDINIARRLIPTEPMSIIINLGISSGFQAVHWDELDFPGIMLVDYVRVYQLAGTESKTSCDPPDHPTAQYIEDHPDVYTNPNYTIWPRDRYPWPKNRLVNVC
ncbi:glycoside hydrolase family 16 protein [Tilletiaria anomala UBC 951]|uniref:Glycoside hydrolase family 16 protein n=1 Tax=Tilletiaria anomala (strain ATCC 24038 / CBS 436.72 / UBC 951) TaxID=1037660 RepID=A0A066W8U7_TILAU|nr:glycoside hydrolase family 16 protein [Tilletiaria anomala UBC 951]KDN50357.1 glycoside hydrolase family 16 protein [Tilletiaria anomala UBC 951]